MLNWCGQIKTLIEQKALAHGLLFALLNNAWCFGDVSGNMLPHRLLGQNEMCESYSLEGETLPHDTLLCFIWIAISLQYVLLLLKDGLFIPVADYMLILQLNQNLR